MWFHKLFNRFLPLPAPPSPVKENRRYVRSYLEVPITFDKESKEVTSTTFDISEEGLYVRTTQFPQTGAQIRARFTLPNEKEIQCVLRVVWINDYSSPSVVINRPPGFGAAFVRLEEEDRRAIMEAIQTRQI